MKPEINAAVGFLSRFLRVKGHVNDRQVQTFNQSLQDILAGTYKTRKKIVKTATDQAPVACKTLVHTNSNVRFFQFEMCSTLR